MAINSAYIPYKMYAKRYRINLSKRAMGKTTETRKEALFKAYSDWLRMRNYSDQTYKSYMGTIRNFWKFCALRKGDPSFKKEDAVQIYLSYRLDEQKLDYSTVNGDYSALQWFYKYVLNREWNVRKLIRPRKEKRLPRTISAAQFSQLLSCMNTEKQKLLVLLYYSTGLRLSEGRNLKWEDIDIAEGIIFVRKGKGHKDRIAILPGELGERLAAYRKTLRPSQVYIFEGKTMGKSIAAKTVQWAIINGRKKAGLPDFVTTHVLRHSYATSCLKNGTDLLSIKSLLGHKKISTTTRYLHLNVPYLKKSYNPLSDPCLKHYLNIPAHPDVEQEEERRMKIVTRSDKSSANSEGSISEDTNPTIENEPS